MKNFRYNEELINFVNDDWFIQLNTSENESIIENVESIFELWSVDNNIKNFLLENKNIMNSKKIPTFFEKEENVESEEYISNFLIDLFNLRIQGLYKVAIDFSKIYEDIREKSFEAKNEFGIDVAIENTLLNLTDKYLNELEESVIKNKMPEEFTYCKNGLMDLFSNFKLMKTKSEKLDKPYQILDFLNTTIDSFDELVIDLDDSMIIHSNKFIAMLMKYEIVFDKLILLTEHLEYKYLEKIYGHEQFTKMNILERYDQIEILKLMSESKDI